MLDQEKVVVATLLFMYVSYKDIHHIHSFFFHEQRKQDYVTCPFSKKTKKEKYQIISSN